MRGKYVSLVGCSNKNYLPFEDYLKREEYLLSLRKKGFQIVLKRQYRALGIGLIVLGVVTIPIPLTTIPLICFGCGLIGVSKYKLISESGRRFRVVKMRLLKWI